MIRTLESKHCEGELAQIVLEDNAGTIYAKCSCGEEYEHGMGQYKYFQNDKEQ